MRTVIALLVGLSVCLGCGPAADEILVDEGPPKVEFKGKPDPRLFGAWSTADGKSTYTFEENGKYTYDGIVTTQGGTFPNKFEGEWSLDGDRVYFRDAEGVVVPYAVSLKDDTLKLTLTGSMKNETVLKRK